MSSGGGSSSSDQTTTVEPWSEQAPYLREVFRGAQRQYRDGSELAGFTQPQQEGQQAALGVAQGPMQQMAGQAGSALESQLAGTSGPELDSMVEAASRPVVNQFQRDVMPSIRRNAVATGGAGGSRQGIAEGLAAGELGQALSDQAVRVQDSQAQRQLQALGMTPQMMQAQTLPADVMRAVGSEQQAQQQAEMDLPWQNLQRYQQLVGGQNWGQTQTAPGPQGPSTGQALLGGAAQGAALGSVVPGIGTGLGAVGGAIAGGLL